MPNWVKKYGEYNVFCAVVLVAIVGYVVWYGMIDPPVANIEPAGAISIGPAGVTVAPKKGTTISLNDGVELPTGEKLKIEASDGTFEMPLMVKLTVSDALWPKDYDVSLTRGTLLHREVLRLFVGTADSYFGSAGRKGPVKVNWEVGKAELESAFGSDARMGCTAVAMAFMESQLTPEALAIRSRIATEGQEFAMFYALEGYAQLFAEYTLPNQSFEKNWYADYFRERPWSDTVGMLNSPSQLTVLAEDMKKYQQDNHRSYTAR